MTLEHKVRVISRKFDLRICKEWSCSKILIHPTQLMCYGYFEKPINHKSLGKISSGTLSLESFWADRFFNLSAFFDTCGKFRNLYFNICLPPKISPSVVDFIDLDVDLIVWPDGLIEIVDFDEFRINSTRFSYPPELEIKVYAAILEVAALLKNTDPIEFVRSVFGEFDGILKNS
ncbi:MAG: hypothetical protein C4325_07220 [Blastocatellia bacterium]